MANLIKVTYELYVVPTAEGALPSLRNEEKLVLNESSYYLYEVYLVMKGKINAGDNANPRIVISVWESEKIKSYTYNSFEDFMFSDELKKAHDAYKVKDEKVATPPEPNRDDKLAKAIENAIERGIVAATEIISKYQKGQLTPEPPATATPEIQKNKKNN